MAIIIRNMRRDKSKRRKKSKNDRNVQETRNVRRSSKTSRVVDALVNSRVSTMSAELTAKLASLDVRTRIQGLEALSARLQKMKPLQEKQDALVKLMSNGINNLKDSNPKVVMLALEVTRMLMRLHVSSFLPKAPIVNMTFDLLFNKYSDAKMPIRTAATELLVDLINMIGLSQGFERLSQQMNHKSVRVKEHILYTILLLHRQHAHSLPDKVPNVVSKVAILLGDTTLSVRELAMYVHTLDFRGL